MLKARRDDRAAFRAFGIRIAVRIKLIFVYALTLWHDAPRLASLALGRIAKLVPSLPPAVHRDDISIAHFLKRVGGKRAAIPSAAVEYYLGIMIGNSFFNVSLDDAFAQVCCSLRVGRLPFVIFAHVNEVKLLARFLFASHFFGCSLAHAALGVVYDLQESFRVIHIRLLRND